METSLQKYVEEFRRIGSRSHPHKPCMLLAVIESAECGALERNEIHYESALLERFALYFKVVRGTPPNPHYPFFHLRGDPRHVIFWHLHPVSGRENFLTGAGERVRHSHSGITTNIAHASLAPELHTLLLDPTARHELRKALIAGLPQKKREQVWNVIKRNSTANQYESALRHAVEHDTAVQVSESVRGVRSAAFRSRPPT